MHDRSEEGYSSLEDLNELKFARTQSYFDRSLTIRFLIGFCFGIILFFFLHYREVYVGNLEIGTEAEQYIVSQVSFTFPDEEATSILRQEAAFEISNIYRLNELEIKERVTEFQKYITQNAEGRARWEEINNSTPLDDVALALSLFSEKLYQIRFSDLRTLSRIDHFPKNELPIDQKDFFAYTPNFTGEPEMLPHSLWETFKVRFLQSSIIPEQISNFLIDYFEPLTWTFEQDIQIEYSLRKLAQAAIQPRQTLVRAGQTLIDQGEKVTPRHIAMLQAMKDKLSQERNLSSPLTIFGTCLMVVIFLGIGTIYLYQNHRPILNSNRKLGLLVAILVLAIMIAKTLELWLLRTNNNYFSLVRFPLFVPLAAVLVTNLLNLRIAALSTILLTVLFTIALSLDPIPFLLVNIITSIAAILTGQNIRRRKEVFVVCIKSWFAAVLVIIAWDLYRNLFLSMAVVYDLVSSFIFMFSTAILTVGLLPVFEYIFRIMTDITLMEFLDPSNELLRRLTIEAPGTYQHSIVVGNLAEAAATAIGCNGLFCRVATQYHDVGKLSNPQYFTENQLGSVDMHQLLLPQESAQVIISHVSEGVALARKVGLPEQFIDIIKEHHGTQLVYYFYCKQLELENGDASRVKEEDYRYMGPKPRTKESTLIMIADTLEAASRSLDMLNEESVRELVERLITQKMQDGQFDDSMLTFEELGVVKEILIKTLLAASHPRIKYPPHAPGEEG
jgi:putative nucleotidyltransferase with HDIG domain